MGLKEMATQATDPSTLHVNENMAAMKIAGGSVLVGTYGLTLNEWVAVLTIIYMICQIILLVPKYVTIISSLINRWKMHE